MQHLEAWLAGDALDHCDGEVEECGRWVVERTFGWMVRWRRLVRDYERRIDVSKSMIYIAMGSLLLQRICP